MKRWLALVLLLLLPLQSAFALAAAYCGHEPATAHAAHIGHHEHQHDDGQQLTGVPGEFDPDCGYCQLHGSLAFAVQAAAIAAGVLVPPLAQPQPAIRSIDLEQHDPPPIARRR